MVWALRLCESKGPNLSGPVLPACSSGDGSGYRSIHAVVFVGEGWGNGMGGFVVGWVDLLLRVWEGRQLSRGDI